MHVFLLLLPKFNFWQGDWTLGYVSIQISDFPSFPNFLFSVYQFYYTGYHVSFYFWSIGSNWFKMVPENENLENISVNIYETDSFTKFDERNPFTVYLITKSSFENFIDLSILKQTEWKRTFEVHSIWKNLMWCISIFEV